MFRDLKHTIVLLVGLSILVSCGQRAEESEEVYAPQIDPARFVEQVDNEFFPLVPGTTFLYELASGSEHVEIYVTEERREVMGVSCVVVRDREYEDEELVEETHDWYAQDADGNVWYFGEDTKELEGGEVVSIAGSWEAGVDGALPGIVMKGQLVVGESYSQEYYKGHAEDMGEVLRLGDTVTVPYGSFEDVLVTKEWTPLEPGVEEQKYYAPGVGLILEVEGGDRMELVSVTGRGVDGN